MDKKKGKKKYLKWIVIVIIVFGIIGAFTGGSEDSNSNDSQTNQTEEKENQSNTTEEKEKTYGIGDTLKVGDVEYTVNSIDSSKSIGDEYLSTKAQEQFLIVNITIKNNGNTSLSVSDDFFKLKKEDKEYTTSSEGAIYLKENIIYTDVNPDASLTGDICFDVTQETIDYKDLQLQVQTGVFGTEKGLINLH